ncbi:MAG: TonB-dependent receptor, partial [Brevundimonas sp.]
MTLAAVSRTALLTALGWGALTGVALAQTAPPQSSTQLDEVVVTGAPFGINRRATTIATTVIDEQTLAQAPAASLGDLVNGLPGVRST